MSNEITNIRSFFQSIQVHLSDVWLDSCINWCKTEILGSNHTLKELQSKVYEQWLLLDLRDVEVACLPPSLSSQKHFILNGNYCLQMMHVIDISKPKLWQLQRIRNNLTKGPQDSDIAGSGKRMLQLTLTDGVQEIEAMEYKPISSLSINLTPGIKIRIIGPVVVRRGRLMLEQQNVKILGGEVEELNVSHAAENVLARILKLPENPNPTVIEEKLLITENEEQCQGYKRIAEIPKSQPPQILPKTTTTEVTPMIIDQDEESKEIEALMLQAERNIERSNSKTPDLFENSDFNPDDFDCIDQFASTSTQGNTVKQNQSKMKKIPSFEGEDDDVFNTIDIDAHLNAVDNKLRENEVESVVTIAKFLEEKNKIGKSSFKIRARFKAVVEKLTVGEEEYKLVIKIEDETGDVVVRVHSDLITEFAGYSPEDIQKLKRSVLCKEGNAVEKVMQAIQKVKDRLVTLNDLILVNTEAHEVPVITKIYC